MLHNKQKKIAVINDLSGFGRCSITVSLPIISYMRLQCCPLPTAILSNHTGYASYFFDDYTKHMPEYIANWKKLSLRFEGIISGFLGSLEQIRLIGNFIEEFRYKETKVLIDPVMGDEGISYATYDQTMCEEMKQLIGLADILTPNLTECCLLTDTPYKKKGWRKEELFAMAEKLAKKGASKIAVSGIDFGSYIGNVVYEKEKEPVIIKVKRSGRDRAGTGDIYSSILCADSVNGVDFETSVRKASLFIRDCIAVTEQIGLPEEDGVCFEQLLHKLR